MTPQRPQRNPVPITLLTGFLGAGKTTVLNTILKGDHGLRIAVLVNDFGAINIDSQLVVGVEGENGTISLQNGCICCTIRGDLLQAVVDLLKRPDVPEYIIIETSGVSDPVGVAETFLLPELKNVVRLDSILTVLDAEQGGKALEGEQYFLAMSQVGVADIVLLNKVDLVNQAQLEETRAWVRDITPKARIIETTYGKIPLELVLGVGAYSPERLTERAAQDIHVHEVGAESDHEHDHDHEHPDHSLVFETWSWETNEPISFRAFRKVVENLPLTIYRAKGVIFLADMPDNRGILQVVGKRVSLTFGEVWNGDSPHTQLVVIGTHGGVDANALRERFESTLAVNQPATELARIKSNVLEWLRVLRKPQ
jgi:G3E family GTPase